jgi:hypothetical protein
LPERQSTDPLFRWSVLPHDLKISKQRYRRPGRLTLSSLWFGHVHAKLSSTLQLGFTFIDDPNSSNEQSVFNYGRQADDRNF